jgi:hypothetical protein
LISEERGRRGEGEGEGRTEGRVDRRKERRGTHSKIEIMLKGLKMENPDVLNTLVELDTEISPEKIIAICKNLPSSEEVGFFFGIWNYFPKFPIWNSKFFLFHSFEETAGVFLKKFGA